MNVTTTNAAIATGAARTSGISRLVRRIHLFTGLFLAPWMAMYAPAVLPSIEPRSPTREKAAGTGRAHRGDVDGAVTQRLNVLSIRNAAWPGKNRQIFPSFAQKSRPGESVGNGTENTTADNQSQAPSSLQRDRDQERRGFGFGGDEVDRFDRFARVRVLPDEFGEFAEFP
jgi:hypothetical protein